MLVYLGSSLLCRGNILVGGLLAQEIQVAGLKGWDQTAIPPSTHRGITRSDCCPLLFTRRDWSSEELMEASAGHSKVVVTLGHRASSWCGLTILLCVGVGKIQQSLPEVCSRASPMKGHCGVVPSTRS